MGLQGWLIATGVTFEIGGIFLVSAEDVAPAWAWSQRKLDAVRRRLRVALRIRREHSSTLTVDLGGAINVAGDVSLLTMAAESATLEERVGYLLREAERTQNRLNDAERELERTKDEQRRIAEEFEKRVEALIGRELQLSKRRYVVLRRVGLACLVIAATLLGLASAAG